MNVNCTYNACRPTSVWFLVYFVCINLYNVYLPTYFLVGSKVVGRWVLGWVLFLGILLQALNIGDVCGVIRFLNINIFFILFFISFELNLFF